MHRSISTLAAAVVLTASASALHAQTTTSGSMSGSAMRSGATDTTLVAQLDSVNAAAKAGLTSLPVSVAGPLLQSLQSKLAASGRPGLQSIATDLGALRTELTMSTVNGARIGAILSRLGPKVTRVASRQSGAVATTLNEIGTELTSAGAQLAGGAR